MKKLKWPVIVLLGAGILWSSAFVGCFVGRHDALVEQAGLDIQMLVGCAALIREGDAQRALPYIESHLSSEASSLLEYRKFSGVARVVFEQLCHSVSGPSVKIDPFSSLTAYRSNYSGNQHGDGAGDFPMPESPKK